MKQLLLILMIALFLTACHGQQSKAMKDQQKAYAILNEKINDGRVATAVGSWSMTANINGKAWKANYMYAPEETSRIIGHYNDESISLPYWRKAMVPGHNETFGHNNAVDIFLSDDVSIYGGYAGEMTITKADGKWIEGIFHCSATDKNTGKTVNITDGLFKIQLQR